VLLGGVLSPDERILVVGQDLVEDRL